MTHLNSTPNKPAAETLGHIGLPAPLSDLARRKWDVIVVGAGHNGLTCAAYLARAGKQVLVLEARDQVGGACTLQETWPGYRISPCAYVVGLLHPLVMQELDLAGHGFRWTPADGGLFIPFEDGSSLQLWDEPEQCEAELKRFAPRDLEGWHALHDLMYRTTEAIRPSDEGDLWLGPAPTREIIEERLQGDEAAIKLLFEWSMAELLDQYVTDERLQAAYLGQGVIGTNASPFQPGTAAIYFHHYCGKMPGAPRGSWGYVAGGMGLVSFLLCDIAREAGAVVATGVPVARIVPAEGVELAGGDRIYAPVVVSNADPKTTLRLLGEGAEPGWRAQVERIPMKSCVAKVNVALHELPNFTARPGALEPHHRATINIPLTKTEWQSGYEIANRGELPERVWAELYLQTAFDPTIAPPGKHVMSIFSQYVPHTFAQGDWDSRREEVGQLVIRSIARHCSNLPEAIIDMEILGPPDVEARLGLSGGHIFHGECLPDYMWSNRLSPRTPMPGVFLCGAGTHPGGSVIAVNGRNAAMEILRD
jgi:phytoene dehydrogenase-like protein